MSFQSQSNILKRNRQIALTVPMMIGFGNSAFAVSHENLLNDDTKRAYYAQYVKIVKEVSKQSGIDIVVNPM
ncbi:MAG: hypothetical protein KHY55_10030 [Streptococcus salivarius]|nr:hypothetical protein [Streptococcus salivarius]